MSEPRDRELARIYREAEASEPPPRIDDAILAASRRSAGSRPRTAGSELVRRSSAPVALAATILLTLTVTLMVFQDLPEPTQISMQPGKTETPAEKPAQPGPGAPAKTISQAESRRDANAQQPAERAFSSESASQPASDAPRASQLRDAPDASSEPQRIQEAQDAARQAHQPDPVRSARAKQAAPSAPAPGASLRRETASGLRSMEAVGVLAGRSAADETKDRPPEKWLEDIRKLKAQGKTPEADRELGEFRKRYPDYRLPEDLR